MSLKEVCRNTFMDKSGALAIPEISAAVSAMSGVTSTLWEFWARGAHFDLQNFGLGMSAVVLALGAAQRIRDGISNG